MTVRRWTAPISMSERKSWGISTSTANCILASRLGCAEISPLSNRFTCQPHRLVVMAPDELGIGGYAAINRRERIAWAKPQRTARRDIGFFPAPAIGQRQAVIALGQREIWI